ncbi:MAG: CHASE2 domain-containing protein [Thermodesulfovibrionales bacterium]
MKKDNLFKICLSVITFAVLSAILTLDLPPFNYLELRIYDLIMHFKSASNSSKVVVIGIDEESFRHLEDWPWHRPLIAEGLKKIDSMDARIIVLDILYAEKDKNPALQEIRTIIEKIKNNPDDVVKKEVLSLFPHLKMTKDEQKRYTEAIINASIADTHRIVLKILLEAEKRIDFDTIFAQNISGVRNILMPIEFVYSKNANSAELPDFLSNSSIPYRCEGFPHQPDHVRFPIQQFGSKAHGFGHVNLTRDIDGSFRRYLPFLCFRDRLFPSLDTTAAIRFRGLSINEFLSILKEPITKPIYFNPAPIKRLQYYSFSDLMKGSIKSDSIKDKVVIVGINSPKAIEYIKVSGGYSVSPLLLRASAIDNLIENNFLYKPSWVLIVEIASLFIIAFFMTIFNRRIRICAFMGLILSLTFTVLFVYLMLFYNLVIHISYPLIMFCMLFVAFYVSDKYKERRHFDSMVKEVIETKSLRFLIGSKTDIGLVRTKNEDNLCVDKSLNLLAIADGVGGNTAGEIASKMAIDEVRAFIKTNNTLSHYTENISSLVRDAILHANRAILKMASLNPLLQGMSTTITLAYINENRIAIGHVGDCRCYLIRGGRMEQLTEDHTVATDKSIRSLNERERQMMRNVLTRALGIEDFVEVDNFEFNVTKDDIIVLCSDGLFTLVEDKDIQEVIEKYKEPHLACNALVNMANKKGGKDNITVIVAHIKG